LRRADDGVDGLLQQLGGSPCALEQDKLGGGERRLVFGGFQLSEDDQRSLEELGMKEGSTVTELLSLCGGGGDGGTKAIQRAYLPSVKVVKRDVKRDMEEELRAKWHNCAVSGKPLVAPMVACELGFIFIKEEILKKIITKDVPPIFSHVRKMKDLFEINLKENQDYDEAKGKTFGAEISVKDRWICPITSRPANGRNHFVALRPCGHCFADAAVKQLGSGECVECGAAFDKGKDVVHLNQAGDELAKARKALEARRAEEKVARAAAAAEGCGEGKKRSALSREEAAAKKAKIDALVGAGANVAGVNGMLSSTISKSAALASKTHEGRSQADAVYASMFKKKSKDDKSDGYDAFWGQGAMAGVLGGR
jgi:hypothetical protein